MLLGAGADVKAKPTGDWGFTVLHHCAENGIVVIPKFFIARGADANATYGLEMKGQR